MDLLFWGLTATVVGKVLLGTTVILVHSRLAKEHRVDSKVIHAVHREFILTGVALLLIVAGYVAELAAYGYIPYVEVTERIDIIAP